MVFQFSESSLSHKTLHFFFNNSGHFAAGISSGGSDQDVHFDGMKQLLKS